MILCGPGLLGKPSKGGTRALPEVREIIILAFSKWAPYCERSVRGPHGNWPASSSWAQLPDNMQESKNFSPTAIRNPDFCQQPHELGRGSQTLERTTTWPTSSLQLCGMPNRGPTKLHLDSWITETDVKCMTFLATEFVVICYEATEH